MLNKNWREQNVTRIKHYKKRKINNHYEDIYYSPAVRYKINKKNEKEIISQLTEHEKYVLYLDSPKWKRKRFKRLKIDKYKCQICSKRATQVHHLTYENIYNEKMKDLQSVCIKCHKTIHNKSNM